MSSIPKKKKFAQALLLATPSELDKYTTLYVHILYLFNIQNSDEIGIISLVFNHINLRNLDNEKP